MKIITEKNVDVCEVLYGMSADQVQEYDPPRVLSKNDVFLSGRERQNW